jgi:hypothetical protein
MFRYDVDSTKIGVAVLVIGTRASNEGETKYAGTAGLVVTRK